MALNGNFQYPAGNLCLGPDGNIYGATVGGGATGGGSIYRYTPRSGAFTTIHSFTIASGFFPWGGVICGSDGNLYGTTRVGGSANQGVVYECSLSGAYSVLYSFTGGMDGGYASANLLQASDGNLYGTTQQGGANKTGTIFMIPLGGGTLTTLHQFEPSSQSWVAPEQAPVQGGDGFLYGAKYYGAAQVTGAGDYGFVWRMGLGGSSFGYSCVPGPAASGGEWFVQPRSVTFNPVDGKLYGTGATQIGGSGTGGVLFSIPVGQNQTPSILYNFDGVNFVVNIAPPTATADGSVYLMVDNPSSNPNIGALFRYFQGSTFEIGATGQTGAKGPVFSGLTADAAGNLFGTSNQGGLQQGGNIFELSLGLDLGPWDKTFADNGNSALSGGGGGSNLQTRWTWGPPPSTVKASPVIASDGTIYLTGINGDVLALSPEGEKLWSINLGQNIISSPTVGARGLLYVAANNGQLFAISTSSQKVVWQYAMNGANWYSSPAVAADGTVYVGCDDGNLYAINGGQLSWSFNTKGLIRTTPAIGPDGAVYVGSADGNLYCVNPNGSERYVFGTGGPIESSPSIGADGAIYFGSDDFSVYCLNPNFTKRWSYQTGAGGKVRGNVVVSRAGQVFAGSDDGHIYILSSTGAKVGSLSATPDVSGLAMGADDVLYFGVDSGGSLMAYNTTSGATKKIFAYGNIHSPPAIGADGTVYAFDGVDGKLHALGTAVAIASVSVSPATVPGGSAVAGSVKLAQAAPIGGAVVTLSSTDPTVTLPLTVAVPSGETTGTFILKTTPVPLNNAVGIIASTGDAYAMTTLSVQAPTVASLTLNPSTVLGGASSQATITLSSPAPIGGLVLSLASSTASVTVPATATVPAGQTTVHFTVTTSLVSTQVTANISASLNGTTTTAALTVNPLKLAKLSFSTSSVIGGSTTIVTGTVTIPTALAVATPVTLASSLVSVASVPTTVTIPAGKTSATFTVTTSDTSATQTVTFTATGPSGDQLTAPLTVKPNPIVSITVSPSTVVGGSSTAVTLTIKLQAPVATAHTFAIGSTEPQAATVPATATIAAGSQSGTVKVSDFSVPFDVFVALWATHSGYTSACLLIVIP